jgi:hypothetical protein
MKITVKRKNQEVKEYEVKYVQIDIPIDFYDIPNDFPLAVKISRNDPIGKWIAYVEIETGMIEGWKQGYAGNLFAKVVDEGNYYLMDADKNIVAARNGYVPNKLIPPTDGYGDYIELEINKDGKITNWYENPSFEEFEYDDYRKYF